MILLATGASVCAAMTILIVVGWRDANTVATAIQALAAVVGLGIALWSGSGTRPRRGRTVTVTDTGDIRGGSGSAVTGAHVTDRGATDVTVHRTGSIEDHRGDATTGYREL